MHKPLKQKNKLDKIDNYGHIGDIQIIIGGGRLQVSWKTKKKLSHWFI